MMHLYYRGSLDYCNYSCNYCPFSKNKCSDLKLEKDKERLLKFITFIKSKNSDKPISIFFVPYGEALIFPWYQEAIIELSKLKFISFISIQTNLSLDVESFLKKLSKKSANLKKIKIWASFHPSMIDCFSFSKKVNFLNDFLDVCVGSVAIKSNLKHLNTLRDLLKPDIYLWLNRLNQGRFKYSNDEISIFKQIDPLFNYELNFYKSKDCIAGKENFFINSNGDAKACAISKNKLFNIYENELKPKEILCKRKTCDCYLAYSNHKAKLFDFFFKEFLPIRIPKKRNFKALFLDYDGTLSNKDGILSKKQLNRLNRWSESINLYIVTSRSYENLLKKSPSLFKILSGGVFSNGALILDFKKNKLKYNKLDLDNSKIKFSKIKKDFYDSHLLRIILPRSFKNVSFENSSTIVENSKCYIQSIFSSKKNGVLQIQDWNNLNDDDFLVAGNSLNDLDMISYFKFSLATLNSPRVLQNKASITMNINHLDFIIKQVKE